MSWMIFPVLLRKPHNHEQIASRGKHGETVVPVFPCDWPARDRLSDAEYGARSSFFFFFLASVLPDWFLVFVQ